MTPAANGVWLSGERFDVAYFLDLEFRKIRRLVTKGSRIGETAGVCRRVRGGHVAWFVSPGNRSLRLWAAGSFYPLDGTVPMHHETSYGGLRSCLVIEPAGGPKVQVCQLTRARSVLKRVDPGYDSLDESMDDFLGDVADIAASPERRAWIAGSKDPAAGPWSLLDKAE